jgi:hypothetical protein
VLLSFPFCVISHTPGSFLFLSRLLFHSSTNIHCSLSHNTSLFHAFCSLVTLPASSSPIPSCERAHPHPCKSLTAARHLSFVLRLSLCQQLCEVTTIRASSYCIHAATAATASSCTGTSGHLTQRLVHAVMRCTRVTSIGIPHPSTFSHNHCSITSLLPSCVHTAALCSPAVVDSMFSSHATSEHCYVLRILLMFLASCCLTIGNYYCLTVSFPFQWLYTLISLPLFQY